MKTKIIYISGGELFEMAQIRAAFEEVKSTLGLDKDTVLFGVPVDCDTAIKDVTDNTQPTVNVIPEPVAEIIPDATEIPEIPEIPQILQEDTEEIELPEEIQRGYIEVELNEEEQRTFKPKIAHVDGNNKLIKQND